MVFDNIKLPTYQLYIIIYYFNIKGDCFKKKICSVFTFKYLTKQHT